jgi:hypothetical protein
MKTKIYFLLLIFTIGICGCGHETKVNEPSKELGSFQLHAQKKGGQYLEVKIINTLPNAKGFAYADCPRSWDVTAIPPNLRLCLADTLTFTSLMNDKLVLYQFQEDSSGIGLCAKQTIYLENFFKVY